MLEKEPLLVHERDAYLQTPLHVALTLQLDKLASFLLCKAAIRPRLDAKDLYGISCQALLELRDDLDPDLYDFELFE